MPEVRPRRVRSEILRSYGGKGGYRLIGQVRALPPDRGVTPATALTGFVGPEHGASVLRAGFQLHVRGSE